MESHPSVTFPLTPDLFDEEEASQENLKLLISTPVGYKDQLDPSLLSDKFGLPVYCDSYKCIDRLIILVQRNKFLRH